jgi:predicted Zn-dependent protease
MKTNLKCALILAAVLSFTGAAGAQEYPNEPYEFLLAKLAAEEGRYDDAIARLDRIIEKSPKDPVLLFERAMMFIDAGRFERAETELRQVVTVNPDLYDAQRVLGRLLLDRAGMDRSRIEQALVHLQAAFKLNPDDLATGSAVAQILMSMNKNLEAERVLATLVERAPDQRSFNYSYAQLLTRIGRGNESAKYLERVIALDPTYGPAIQQLLDTYQAANQWEKAAAVLQPLIDEDPLNVDLQRRQATYYLRAGNAQKARDAFRALVAADPKDKQSQLYLAQTLNDLQQYAEAQKMFDQLLSAGPNDPDALAGLGIAYLGQKNYAEAQKIFNQLLTLPEIPISVQTLARSQLAYIDLQKGNYESAIETAKAAFIFDDEPNASAIDIALEALKKQKKFAEGVVLLQPLIDKHAADAFLNARYIEWLSRAGEKAKAEQAAQTQVKFGTRNTVGAAEAYIRAGDAPAAIQLLQTAIKAKPDEVDLLFELASAYERSGDRKNAEKAFLSLLEKKPEHAPTLNYLGYMWAEDNRNLEKAHEMLERAVSQDPENGAYVDSLGWIYFRLGKLDLAEKYLTDATRLMPRDATVHEHLADVVAKRGDTTRALQIYKLALTLEPDAKEGDQIRSKIADIERQGQTSQR